MENSVKLSNNERWFEEMRYQFELKLLDAGVSPEVAPVLAGDLVLELYGNA